MTGRAPRTILANVNSDTMAENPGPAYLRAMAVVTPRMLWEAEPGDCLVTLAPCPPRFKDYVADVTGLDVHRVELVEPPAIATAHALDVAAGQGATDRVTARPDLDAFALDRPVLDFVRRTGLRLLPYGTPPSDATLAAVRLANTKHGFRAAAVALGLPVAPGGYAENLSDLVDGLVAFLSEYPSAIVKTDRSSTGFGNLVIEAEPRATIVDRIRAAVDDQPAGGCGWVYEEYLPLYASPSIELLAQDSGVTGYYSCDQRTLHNAWTGMVSPSPADPADPELRKAAALFGDWLHGQGYRGWFDVDCGVHAGGWVLTEANVRTTGGTYLEKLARRLRPGDSPAHWRADGRFGPDGPDFPEAVRRLAAEGLGGDSPEVRAVLVTDTRDLDRKWRYLVVGADAEVVAEAERVVEGVLGI